MEQQLALLTGIYDQIAKFLVNYTFQLVGAIIVLLLGLVLARKLGNWAEQFMLKHKIDVTLSRFAASAVKVIVIVMVAIVALSQIGVSVAPFVAAIGAVSLGAGLALQKQLSNYSAGVSIVITRPFVVGDTITVKGVTGVVKQVRLANTILADEDDVRITIPNHHIVGEIIHNSASESIVEMTFNIGYDSDPLRVVELVKAAIVSQDAVSKSRPPQVGIQEFGTNGYTLGLRYWAATVSLFQTRCQTNAAIHLALQRNAIVIPVPIMRVMPASGQ
jgi:small conductance mechanosensitive channel